MTTNLEVTTHGLLVDAVKLSSRLRFPKSCADIEHKMRPVSPIIFKTENLGQVGASEISFQHVTQGSAVNSLEKLNRAW